MTEQQKHAPSSAGSEDILTKLDGAWDEDFKANLMHYCDLAAQEIRKLRAEAAAAHAEVVQTQDELGALLHAAEARARAPAQSSADPAVLRDALKNMMGAYDTPLSRRRFPPDEFMQAALESGRAALAAQPPAAPVETNADLPTHNDVRGILPPSSAGTAKALDDLEIFIGEVDGSEAAEGGTIDGTEAIEALNALRAAFAQPQPSAGCGDPGCTDPNCDYGKGPLRCQSCGAPIVDEPQTLSTPEGGK
jgi:hypothetical protein